MCVYVCVCVCVCEGVIEGESEKEGGDAEVKARKDPEGERRRNTIRGVRGGEGGASESPFSQASIHYLFK